MRIGIDARMYGPQHSGLGRYVQQLIEQLKELDDKHEYVIFLKREVFDTFELPNERWKKVLADIHWYGMAEQVKLPGIIHREEIDLMHFPHWNVPLLYRGPFIVTIHDLIMFHYSRREATTLGPIMYAIKDAAHRILVKSTVNRAKHIIATSEFTKKDIVETFRVPKENIAVTYQAASVRNQESGIGNWESVQRKYDITQPYVLYVGNAYPHKNLDKLVEAWAAFEKEHDEYQLVLVGKESQFYNRIKHTAEQLHGNSIVFTGFVPDDELIMLYQRAHLYVFPSLYEGFGLPPLEAMSFGLPVISSSASCLPEVLGTGALYFDPSSTDDIIRALEQGTEDEEIRYTLQQNAKEELKRYSWKKLATKTRDIYQNMK